LLDRQSFQKFLNREGHYERIPQMVDELVRRRVAVLAPNTPAAQATKRAAGNIPVVFFSDEHARSTCGVPDLRQQLVRRCVWQWTGNTPIAESVALQCCGIWRSLSTRPRSSLRSTGAVIIVRPDRARRPVAGAGDITIADDRSIVRPQPDFAKKKSATSASSRSAKPQSAPLFKVRLPKSTHPAPLAQS
jgi:hypothetical protein